APPSPSPNPSEGGSGPDPWRNELTAPHCSANRVPAPTMSPPVAGSREGSRPNVAARIFNRARRAARAGPSGPHPLRVPAVWHTLELVLAAIFKLNTRARDEILHCAGDEYLGWLSKRGDT